MSDTQVADPVKAASPPTSYEQRCRDAEAASVRKVQDLAREFFGIANRLCGATRALSSEVAQPGMVAELARLSTLAHEAHEKLDRELLEGLSAPLTPYRSKLADESYGAPQVVDLVDGHGLKHRVQIRFEEAR